MQIPTENNLISIGFRHISHGFPGKQLVNVIFQIIIFIIIIIIVAEKLQLSVVGVFTSLTSRIIQYSLSELLTEAFSEYINVMFTASKSLNSFLQKIHN